MKKHLAQNIRQRSQESNVAFKSTSAKLSDICKNLLNDDKLSLMNIKELGERIALEQKNHIHQLIVCNQNKLNEQLDFHKNDNIDEQPIFIICQNECLWVTFALVKHQGTITCLINAFTNTPILEEIKTEVKECFGDNVEIKIHCGKENVKNESIFCIKALETMMVHLKPNKKENFIANFENPTEIWFEWQKLSMAKLKAQLFSLVNEGYYAVVANDIDQLSRDTAFKNAIKEFINKIPLPEDIQLFKRYETLLNEYIEIEENEIDIDSTRREILEAQLEEAKDKAFSKVHPLLQTQITNNETGDQHMIISDEFPIQMKKFTRIFEPLMLMKADEKLDKMIEEISSKLGLNYEKIKFFFKFNEEVKTDNNDAISKTIDEIINLLPHYAIQNFEPMRSNKTLEQLLLEMKEVKSKTLEERSKTLNIDALREEYHKVKDFHKLWNNNYALKVQQWAISKKGKLEDSEIYEAIAILDRANELVTGGHKLRDTQILSVLTFLQQKDKGQLTQIQTGEGKTTIISILAAIKALKGEKVDVITSNPVLATDGVKDKQLFYDLLKLSVSTNNLDENYKNGPRGCYNADIVYGSISNFQFDYLKDSFLGQSTRAGRPFECIILDEVDSMIIDNASHIAKLSAPLPGMESLKYVYIKIWQELHKAEEKITREFGKKIEVTDKTIESLSLVVDEVDAQYLSFYENSIQKMKKSIKLANPTKIDIIPSHIQEYADNSLDRWIDNALYAKYVYHENECYVIRTKDNEKVIQPVDYANTGIILKNTMWQYGLHQFLQLKHNLHLTSESLTSCFISNLGYINKYGNQIFGLTGTLGSEAEQRLLSSIYNVEYAKIPTYKEKKFIEIDAEIVDDEIFALRIAMIVSSTIANRRAVLIICKTIKDTLDIHKVLRRSVGINITLFLDEQNAHITDQEIDCGDVIIATNIAGRGTDFKTSANLESNKGLHVICAFLPSNKRVGNQAWGRTARQGNHGTGQLIIKKSEVDKLGLDSNCTMEMIKIARDNKEKERLKLIQEMKISELKFQDELFELFCTLFKRLQKKFKNKEEEFVLRDLTEFWAFWLNNQSFRMPEIAITNAKKEFEKFELAANKAINGEIQFNPYYSIHQAEYFLLSNDLNKAEQCLYKAISLSENPAILHSVYFKLFEIAIEKGGVFTDKCRQALADIFFISKITPDRAYKETAKTHLEQAKKALEKELKYIEKFFKDDDFQKILRNNANNEPTAISLNELQRENFFLKHIVSKQQALNFGIHHANSLIQQINECTGGISIRCRVSDYLIKFEPQNDDERKINDVIMNSELMELSIIGSNVVYSLQNVYNICPAIIKAARIQIISGITLIGCGLIFPPASTVTSYIGVMAFVEGLSDILVESMDMNSDGEFHQKAYIKRKLISCCLGIFLTVSINKLRCPEFLMKVVNQCRRISETLRKCPKLKIVFESLAKYFDKVGDMCENMLVSVNFNNMNHLNSLSINKNLQMFEVTCNTI